MQKQNDHIDQNYFTTANALYFTVPPNILFMIMLITITNVVAD